MKYRILLPLAALAAGSTVAAESTDSVVVTATRVAQTVDQTLVAVSVLTREDIERSSSSSLPELLAQLPGMDTSVAGGPGKTSSLYLRGTNDNHLLVLIDGVKVGSATLGSIPFQDIPVEQIERVEVVRGPRSSLYGSEAIGGVIQIFTRKTPGGERSYVRAGAGNQSQKSFSAGFSSANDQGSLSLNLSHYETHGIHSYEGKDSDRDGYENNSLSLGLVRHLGEATQLQFNALHIESDNHYDSYNYELGGHYEDQSNNTQQTLSLKLSSAVNDHLDLKLGVSQHRDESENDFLDCALYDFNPPYPCLSYVAAQSQFESKRRAVEAVADYYLHDSQILTLGAELRTDEVSGVDYARDERDNRAVFGQWQAEHGKLSVLAGLRHDDDQLFGSENTGNLNLGYQLDSQRRLLASYGTAYKAPTFNDLYYPFDGFFHGNEDIKSETSETMELGYEAKHGAVEYSVRGYLTRIDDLIEWVYIDCYPCQPVNVNRAEIKGLEFEARAALGAWLASANATFIDPRDKDADTVLINRARRTLQLSLARKLDAWTLSGEFLAKGERYADKENTRKMPGYGLVNMKVQYALNSQLKVEAKVHNLLDKQYVTKLDFEGGAYNSLDRSYLLSLSYAL